MQSAGITPLSSHLAARIRDHGPISFAEFMGEALYHPQFGYYSRKDAQRFADFYTSVDVHPIFGRLLARQSALRLPAELIRDEALSAAELSSSNAGTKVSGT